MGATQERTEVPAVAGAANTRPERSDWLLSPPVVAMGGFILICLSLYFLRAAAPVLNPITLALFMVTLALPAYRWMIAHKVNKGLVLVVIMLSLLLIGVGIALLVRISVNALLDGLGAYSSSIEALLQQWSAQLQALGIDTSGWADAIASAINGMLQGILLDLVETASLFGLAAVLAAFLLLEARRFGRLLNSSMRELPYLGVTPKVMDAAITYFFIRIRLNVITGAAFGLVLWLLGIDYALLWRILTMLLSFIPYIGLVLASIPAVLLGLAEYDLGRAILVVVAVVVINFLVENIVAPSYTGRTLRLSTSVVFISFLFWAWLLGPIGALLAMPITVLLMLTFGSYDSTRWLAQLIGEIEAEPT